MEPFDWSLSPSSTSASSTVDPLDIPSDHDLFFHEYIDFDDLWVDLLAWGRSSGIGFMKVRSSNYRDGRPTNITIGCDCGNSRPSQATIRQTISIKTNYGFRVIAKQLKDQHWTFNVYEGKRHHNHPSTDTTNAEITTHRFYSNFITEMKEYIAAQSSNTLARLREIYQYL